MHVVLRGEKFENVFETPPLYCHPRCHFIPPSQPASPSHYPFLLAAAPLALHQIACGASGKSLARHNAICRILVSAACRELGVTPQLIDRLHSDPHSRRMVDAIITTFDRMPEHLGIDATVSVSLLPSYIAAASKSASSIFDQRAREKARKHVGYSEDTTGVKGFLACVVNHLGGIGPKAFWTWFDATFTEGSLAEADAHHVRTSAMRRKSLALQAAQAALMRASADMLARCSAPVV